MTLLDPRVFRGVVPTGEMGRLFDLETGGLQQWPEVDRIQDEAVLRRLFAQTISASTTQASPYLGDVTILRRENASPFDEPEWGNLILGEVRQIEKGSELPIAELLSLVFGPGQGRGVRA